MLLRPQKEVPWMFQMPDVNAVCFLTAVVFPSKLTKAVASEGDRVVISTNMAR
jgi:hypothetical protein